MRWVRLRLNRREPEMGSFVWPDLAQAVGWLPIFFLGAMGVAMVAYVVLDGYDLGVGILLNSANDSE